MRFLKTFTTIIALFFIVSALVVLIVFSNHEKATTFGVLGIIFLLLSILLNMKKN